MALENRPRMMSQVSAQTVEFACAGRPYTGQDALNQIHRTGPSLVLINIRLPGMSGVERARLLKRILPGPIVVYMSGLVY